MFSSIIGFFKNLKKLQYRKEKKETNKKIKQEEIKILKQDKNKLVGTARTKAKETDVVKESKKKEKKLQTDVLLLSLVETFIEFLEFTFGTVLGFVIFILFCIAIVFIIIWIVINGLLHIDYYINDNSFFGPDEENCIQSSQVLQQSSWSELNINTLNGTITPYQQNLYELFSIYDEFLKGDGTNIPLLKEMPHDVAFRVFRGVCACETGFYLWGKNDTSHSVLKDMCTTHSTPPYLGPFAMDSSYSLDSDGLYKIWDGRDFVAEWKKKYPKIGSQSDHYWIPYAAPLSALMANEHGLYTGVQVGSSGYEEKKAYVFERMEHFGIEANKEECWQYIRAFFCVAGYLNGDGVSGMDYVITTSLKGKHGGKARIDFWCALFAASSDVDANRSFNNYSVILNEETYLNYGEGEGGLRQWIYGPDAFYDTSTDLGSLEFGGGKSPRIKVENTELTVPVVRYVYEKYKDDPTMTEAWKHLKGSSGQFKMSYWYPLASLWQGNHIEAELGGRLPISSGGNIEDCECYESGGVIGGYIGNIDISNIQTGVAQGPWTQEVLDYLNSGTGDIVGNGSSDISVLRTYFGRVAAIENPNKKTSFSDGRTVEEWRQQTKWKVPFYVQNITDPEGGSDKFIPNFASGAGMWSGCHIYMYSYMASALTGRVINAVELGVGAVKSGNFSYNATSNPHTGIPATFNNLGLKALGYRESSGAYAGDLSDFESHFGVTKNELFSSDSAVLQKTFDTILSKDGIIGLAMGQPIANGENHYVVISEKVGDKYRMVGYNLKPYKESTSAIAARYSEDVYPWDYIFKHMYTHYAKPGYNGQRFYAYNPNLNTSSIGEVSSTSNSSAITDFNNFLFIGDSLTNQMQANMDIVSEGADIVAEGNIRVDNWKTKYFDNDKLATKEVNMDTFGKPGHSVSKTKDLSSLNGVVIMLGSNGFGSSTYTSLLTDLLGKVSCNIYVQSIPPCTSSYYYDASHGASWYKSEVEKYNSAVKAFCDSTDRLYYIETFKNLTTSDGWLDTSYAKDTIHLNASGYQKQYQNILDAINAIGGVSTNNTNKISDNCISNKNSATVSTVGAADLDLDVIDKVEYCSPNQRHFTYSEMKPEDVKFIVVHYWAWESKTTAHGMTLVEGYHNAGYKNGWAQYVIGSDGIFRVTPELYKAPHCGVSGANSTNSIHNTHPEWGTELCTNYNSIGIEAGNLNLGNTVNHKYVYERSVVENMVSLVKALMVKYNVDIDHVYRHYDCTLKTCPAPFLDKEYKFKYTDYDKGESQNWKAFKQALVSDTIDWSLFDEYVVEDVPDA